jgi:hypothetical protein
MKDHPCTDVAVMNETIRNSGRLTKSFESDSLYCIVRFMLWMPHYCCSLNDAARALDAHHYGCRQSDIPKLRLGNIGRLLVRNKHIFRPIPVSEYAYYNITVYYNDGKWVRYYQLQWQFMQYMYYYAQGILTIP